MTKEEIKKLSDTIITAVHQVDPNSYYSRPVSHDEYCAFLNGADYSAEIILKSIGDLWKKAEELL